MNGNKLKNICRVMHNWVAHCNLILSTGISVFFIVEHRATFLLGLLQVTTNFLWKVRHVLHYNCERDYHLFPCFYVAVLCCCIHCYTNIFWAISLRQRLLVFAGYNSLFCVAHHPAMPSEGCRTEQNWQTLSL